jgi:hypothetical protein
MKAFTPSQLEDIKAWVEQQFAVVENNEHRVALEYVDSLLEHIKNTSDEHEVLRTQYYALKNAANKLAVARNAAIFAEGRRGIAEKEFFELLDE